MTALIENGSIKEDDGLGSTLQADGETGADADGKFFKPSNSILWENELGSLDFTSTMTLVFTGLDDSYAQFAFFTQQDLFFAFEFWYGDLYIEGTLRKACFPDMMLLAYDASSALITIYIPTFPCYPYSLCLPITCS